MSKPSWPEDYTNCYAQRDLDAAVASEREACAKIADAATVAELTGPTHGAWERGYQRAAADIAWNIRSRSGAQVEQPADASATADSASSRVNPKSPPLSEGGKE